MSGIESKRSYDKYCLDEEGEDLARRKYVAQVVKNRDGTEVEDGWQKIDYAAKCTTPGCDRQCMIRVEIEDNLIMQLELDDCNDEPCIKRS